MLRKLLDSTKLFTPVCSREKDTLSLFTSEPRGSLLDYGCGKGQLSMALAEMGFAVTGIDQSTEEIDACLKQLQSTSDAQNSPPPHTLIFCIATSQK